MYTEVAKHILDHCICGVLRDRAVLLATHNLHTLERADQLLLLEGRRVAFKVIIVWVACRYGWGVWGGG